MAGLSKREAKAVEPFDPFARFDRLFDEWTHMLPFGVRSRSPTGWPKR